MQIHPARLAPLFVVAALTLTGCVSAKYKLAPKSPAHTSPPPALEITAASSTAHATLHTVVVFHGPGSWKRDAYWDEYIVTLTNTAEVPLTFDQAVLYNLTDHESRPGHNPWELDKISRHRLKVAKRTGRNLALGVGITGAWVGSLSLVASNITIWGGVSNASAVTAGAAGMIGIPLVLLGSSVRTMVARRAIATEFARRELDLPLTLAPGDSRTGSLFFPVTPGPTRLFLQGGDASGHGHDLTLDLTPLAGLHLRPAKPAR
ncbi:hypothetical protein ESB00_18635 [Oleiharenicola lentus]|jgi:hypothetical protein|uniref:Uncharacterized protein n=1 Tax=Oleiharenicola lentus TaxID=2508720 RepID=A0A4Q1C5I6_9BACT|nr:hypothetical protein [Oleiharenicola lentus]RXK53704.1 hypothetical protein ESB00_18635 [Oleiharenicola lentus]